MEGGVATGEGSTVAATSSSSAAAAVPSSSPTSRASAASPAQGMEAPTGLHKLRGPSPIVWAMRTRVAPPPPLAEPIPRPVYPPPPPPQAPIPEKRRRGRPRKCESLPPPPGFAPLPAARAQPTPAAPAQGKGKLDGLQPHVLTIAAGEDITSRVIAVSQLHSKAVCVLSALGAVKEAFLLQPSGVILNHKGPLEIIRLSGSILTPNDHRCLRVTLATVNSFVLSGIIAGPLIAETSVQAILGSFHNATFWPNNAPRATVACHPNTQGTVGICSALPPNPESAPCTSIGQNGSSIENVAFWPNNSPRAAVACHLKTQGTAGNGSTPPSESPNPGPAPCAPVEQNESIEIDVKPTLGVLNPDYAACSRAAEQNGPGEIDVKPFLGVNNPIGQISTSQGGTEEVHGLDS